MAEYCTQAHLVARFGEAELIGNSDRSDSGDVDAGVVNAAIAKASNIIDSYIGARYALPLASADPVLQGICEDIARHALYTVDRPELVQKAYEAAIALLKDIARGVARLSIPEPAAATPAQNEVLYQPGDRSVSRSELRKL